MTLNKVLVTGGAGFIGSALVRDLFSFGYDVDAIDSFSDYYSPDLKKQRIFSLLGENAQKVRHLDISKIGRAHV